MDIGYISDTVSDYGKALDCCKSASDLKAVTALYRRVASDADAVAQEMLDTEFAEFAAGLKKERKGLFAGEEWCEKYGAILMPELMIHVTIAADKFKVPFGLAFIKAVESGFIVEKDGVATWRGKAAA